MAKFLRDHPGISAVKIEHYRTPVVNEAIAYIADLSKGLAENKNGNSHLFVENSRSVARTRIELVFRP